MQTKGQKNREGLGILEVYSIMYWVSTAGYRLVVFIAGYLGLLVLGRE